MIYYTPHILHLMAGQGRLINLYYRSSIVYLAACGETLNIDFTLPFNEFVPTTCHTRFSLRVSHKLSECNLKIICSFIYLTVIVFFPPCLESDLTDVWSAHISVQFFFFSHNKAEGVWSWRIYCVVNDASALTPAVDNTWEFTPVLCPPQAEDTDLRLSLPECHPSRYPLLTLAKDYQNIKLPPDVFLPGENQGAPPPKPAKPRWRNITHAEWVSSQQSGGGGWGGKKRTCSQRAGMIHRCNTDSRLCLGGVAMATGGLFMWKRHSPSAFYKVSLCLHWVSCTRLCVGNIQVERERWTHY